MISSSFKLYWIGVSDVKEDVPDKMKRRRRVYRNNSSANLP